MRICQEMSARSLMDAVRSRRGIPAVKQIIVADLKSSLKNMHLLKNFVVLLTTSYDSIENPLCILRYYVKVD